MAASLVAWQSYHLWTPCDARVWTEAWSDKPFLGDVAGQHSRVMNLPVFSGLSCGFLTLAFLMTTEEGSKRA